MGSLVKKCVFILVIVSEDISKFKLRISQNRKFADKMNTAQSNSYG